MSDRLKTGAAVLLLLSLGIVHGAADADPKAHVFGTADDLEWKPVASLPAGATMAVIAGDPGKKGPFTLRIRVPADYEIPPHWHPAPENITVLEGTFNVGMGDVLDRNATQAMPAGAYAVMPPGMRHFVWTDEAATIQLHGTGPWQINYVDEAEDPR